MLKGYRIRNYDFKLVLLVLALSGVGILAIGSAEPSLQGRQVMGVIAGAFMMIIISLLDYSLLIRLNWLFYGANLVLLVLVRYMGESSGGAQRWLPVTDSFRFQPSETAKILLILFFAQYIMKHRERINSLHILASCVGLILLPWYLVFRQPDLSTSIVLIVLFCVIMFAGGVRFRIIFGVLAVAVPAFAVVLTLALQPGSGILGEFQQNRIFAFLEPEKYATTTAYQQLNSVTAIASGMLNGKGYLNNEITSVNNGNFVSENQTDFIFSVIGEEFGFKGTLLVIVLLFAAAMECIKIARRAKDMAGTVIAAGMGGLIAFQGFFNIGVTTFILPNTGLPLPFVSYGLTSLMSLYMGMGFVLNVRLQSGSRSQRSGTWNAD